MSYGVSVIVGAVIGALAAVLGSAVTAWLVSRSTRRERRAAAYVDFVAQASLIGLLVQGIRTLFLTGVEIRAGQVDPLAVLDFFRRDLLSGYRATSEVQIVGSKEAVALTQRIMEEAGTLIEGGFAVGDVGEVRASILTLLTGLPFTAEKQKAVEDGITRRWPGGVHQVGARGNGPIVVEGMKYRLAI